jgi:hypothetical protein
MLKLVVVGVVVLLAAWAVVYAMDYRGNYNVTVSGVIASEAPYEAVGVNVVATVEGTSMLDLLSMEGSGGSALLYSIRVTLNYTGLSEIYSEATMSNVAVGAQESWSVTMENVPKGQATVRVEIVHVAFDTVTWQDSFTVWVGA